MTGNPIASMVMKSHISPNNVGAASHPTKYGINNFYTAIFFIFDQFYFYTFYPLILCHSQYFIFLTHPHNIIIILNTLIKWQITLFLLIAKYFCGGDVIFLERMFGPWPGIISNYGCGTFRRNLIIGPGPYNPLWEKMIFSYSQ